MVRSQEIDARGDDFWSSLLSVRRLMLLTLSVGIVQVVAYWLFAMFASTDGGTPIPQPDTLLYCQAARRICEGHAFSYSAGAAVSTGTTSVLHPFLLAVPYALGCTGDSLLTAGFLLNGAFYLVFLLGWSLAFRGWLGSTRCCLLACLVLALFGQTAFSALAQSDIGLWLAVSGLLATALATECFPLLAVMLLLGPWVRPEGMVCVIAFLGIGVLDLVLRRRLGFSRRDWLLTGAAVLSMMGVFAFNHALTGQAQFASVADKGHLVNCSFHVAIFSICEDFITIVKRFFLGLECGAPRDFFCFPLWGGVLIGLGVCACRVEARKIKGLAVFALACFGGMLTVAQSGWQGTNLDRYLAWIAPLAILFLAVGAGFAARRLVSPMARWIVAFAILAQTGWCAVGCWGIYGKNCARMEPNRHFMAACDAFLPPTASVGGFKGVGFAYGLSDRRFAHLTGIYSPEFRCPKTHQALEELKNCPEKRFDYWLVDAQRECAFAANRQEVLWGEQALVGPNGFELRKADWSAYDRAAAVPAVPGKSLVARVDVGRPADEAAAGYRIFDRYARPAFEPFIQIDSLHGKAAIEVGRLVCGGDEMTVDVQPGRDLTVVMRTLAKATVIETDGVLREPVTGSFGPKLALNIQIDDDRAMIPVALDCPTNGFADVSFTIPGTKIARTPCKVSLLGDHIACGYWLYQ